MTQKARARNRSNRSIIPVTKTHGLTDRSHMIFLPLYFSVCIV